MKKLTEILSFILTTIFVVGGLFLAICAIGVVIELFSYSPSTGLGELLDLILMPIIIIGIAAVALLSVSAIGGGLLSFFILRTADKKFAGDENKTKRIILKCIAYAILIIIIIRFAKFF